jgi:hypothetical protein
LQNRGPAGHRFTDTAHQWRLLRSGKDPLSAPAGIPIDFGSDVSQQVRHVLNSVE